MFELYKELFDIALKTSINAIRGVLNEAFYANWLEGEYIEFLNYVEQYVNI